MAADSWADAGVASEVISSAVSTAICCIASDSSSIACLLKVRSCSSCLAGRVSASISGIVLTCTSLRASQDDITVDSLLVSEKWVSRKADRDNVLPRRSEVEAIALPPNALVLGVVLARRTLSNRVRSASSDGPDEWAVWLARARLVSCDATGTDGSIGSSVFLCESAASWKGLGSFKTASRSDAEECFSSIAWRKLLFRKLERNREGALDVFAELEMAEIAPTSAFVPAVISADVVVGAAASGTAAGT